MAISNQSTNLDVLRAVAVTCVVADHTVRFMGAEAVGPVTMAALGRLGVLMFFVHTCLVLMFSLERQEARGDERLALPFFVRRAFRIYPLSVFVVLLVVLLGLPGAFIVAGHVRLLSPTLGQLASNLLLVQNVVFPANVIGPLWSLPLEVQMYLALPGLYLLARRPRAVGALMALWVGSVAIGLAVPHLPGASRLSILSFVPNFLPGVLAYAVSRRVPMRLPGWAFGGLLAALAAAFLLAPSEPTGWVVCLALGFLIPQVRDIRDGALTRAAALVAKYSYGVYLSHVVVIWLALERFGPALGTMRWAAFVLLLFAVPVALFHAIESPAISLGVRVARRLAAARAGEPAASAAPAVGAAEV